MSDVAERWLPVVGHEGLYEVSDRGRLRSVSRVVKCGGTAVRLLPGRNLVQGKTHHGYWRINLTDGNGRTGIRLVHQLVLEAFSGPRLPGQESRHLDGDRLNNRVGNLAWGTSKENSADRVRLGRVGRANGTANGNAKLTEDQVREIRRLVRDGVRPPKIAERFGIRPHAVRKISAGLRWGWLKDEDAA